VGGGEDAQLPEASPRRFVMMVSAGSC
jgi:hypothetical protein